MIVAEKTVCLHPFLCPGKTIVTLNKPDTDGLLGLFVRASVLKTCYAVFTKITGISPLPKLFVGEGSSALARTRAPQGVPEGPVREPSVFSYGVNFRLDEGFLG